MSNLIDRQQAIDELEKIPVREFKKSDNGLLDALVSIGDVYMALMQLLPSARSCKQTCKSMYADVSDLVSRQAAIDAIDKCAVWIMYAQGDSQKDETEFAKNIIKQTKMAIKSMLREDLPSAQPEQLGTNLAEVGTDLINRAEAIETVTKCNAKDMSGFDWIRMQEAVDKLKELPSAQCALTCDGCRHVGTYDTDFPCNGCIRREKDYYEQEQ